MAASATIMNLGDIYNDLYSYSLPKHVLEGFLDGQAFDRTVSHTPDEAQRLHRDIDAIYQRIMAQTPVKEKLAVITAGAPGAGKTTLQEQLLAESDKSYAYVCPDAVCLKQMELTYGAEIADGDGAKEARRLAYNNWRPGSNAAAHLILGNLIRQGYGFYFGSTSTGDKTHFFFNHLKKQGYKIHLVHVSASDDVRFAANTTRDDFFVQTTKDDEVEKGKLLPQRINDTYLEFADKIDFYHRSAADGDAKLAATWTREGGVEVIDRDEYARVKEIHNAGATEAALKWEASVEKRRDLQVDGASI
ncbi:MAG: zeta toxin family protein [Simkaniaceae bacterium]|nr:zeta toxin family protein [Candidatus Sacchlamyda saccharinae]